MGMGIGMGMGMGTGQTGRGGEEGGEIIVTVFGMHHGNLHLPDANLLESQRRNPAARLDRIRRPSSLSTLTLLARRRPHQSLLKRGCE